MLHTTSTSSDLFTWKQQKSYKIHSCQPLGAHRSPWHNHPCRDNPDQSELKQIPFQWECQLTQQDSEQLQQKYPELETRTHLWASTSSSISQMMVTSCGSGLFLLQRSSLGLGRSSSVRELPRCVPDHSSTSFTSALVSQPFVSFVEKKTNRLQSSLILDRHLEWLL